LIRAGTRRSRRRRSSPNRSIPGRSGARRTLARLHLRRPRPQRRSLRRIEPLRISERAGRKPALRLRLLRRTQGCGERKAGSQALHEPPATLHPLASPGMLGGVEAPTPEPEAFPEESSLLHQRRLDERVSLRGLRQAFAFGETRSSSAPHRGRYPVPKSRDLAGSPGIVEGGKCAFSWSVVHF